MIACREARGTSCITVPRFVLHYCLQLYQICTVIGPELMTFVLQNIFFQKDILYFTEISSLYLLKKI